MSISSREAPQRPTARANRELPRGALVAMAAAGVDVPAAARAAGIRPARLDADEVGLTDAELSSMFSAALDQTGDPALGLRIGAAIQAELMGIVGMALTTAATFGAAIARCARYKRLLGDSRVWVDHLGEERVLRVAASGPGAAFRFVDDVELAFLASFGRRMTLEQVWPSRVELRGPRPAHAARYEQVFAVPVRFGASADGLVYAGAALEARLLGENALLHATVTQLAERRLSERHDRFMARVRAVVEQLLPEGEPRLADVSRRLVTPSRTLQRRLRDEGASFSAVVDQVRRDLTVRHLREARLTPAEMSYLTGFSHPNSFYRAVRRWSNESPEAFRRLSRARGRGGPGAR